MEGAAPHCFRESGLHQDRALVVTDKIVVTVATVGSTVHCVMIPQKSFRHLQAAAVTSEAPQVQVQTQPVSLTAAFVGRVTDAKLLAHSAHRPDVTTGNGLAPAAL